MIKEIYSVFDRKAGIHGNPVFVRSEAEVVRELERVSADHIFVTNSEDFVLVYLGSFDDVKGTFELVAVPQVILPLSVIMPQVQVPLSSDSAQMDVEDFINGAGHDGREPEGAI